VAKTESLPWATAIPDGSVLGMSACNYNEGEVLLYDNDLQSHGALYFHFMGLKQRRFWRDFSNCDLNRTSFTPCGIVSGLSDPSVRQSVAFNARCWRDQFPGNVYRAMKGSIPDLVIQKLKRQKYMCASLVSVANTKIAR
jgi:hypothetical protein